MRSFWFGIVMSVSTCSASCARPSSARRDALAALEEERLGDDADRERALFTRELRDDGRRAGAGAAAHAGGDEDHVRAGDELLDALHVLERRLAAALGVGAGAEAARDAAPPMLSLWARRWR